MTNKEKMDRVQGLMVYVGSLAHGLELLLGKGSDSVASRSGRKVGLAQKVEKTANGDLEAALAQTQEEMKRLGINWPFRAYKRSTESELVKDDEGWKELDIAVENCVVRCTLFRYGFPQKGSLCQTKHALFCGLFDQVYGCKSQMSIIHAGENACMLKLRMRD
jgi:hypothetical protein